MNRGLLEPSLLPKPRFRPNLGFQPLFFLQPASASSSSLPLCTIFSFSSETSSNLPSTTDPPTLGFSPQHIQPPQTPQLVVKIHPKALSTTSWTRGSLPRNTQLLPGHLIKGINKGSSTFGIIGKGTHTYHNPFHHHSSAEIHSSFGIIGKETHTYHSPFHHHSSAEIHSSWSPIIRQAPKLLDPLRHLHNPYELIRDHPKGSRAPVPTSFTYGILAHCLEIQEADRCFSL